MQSKLPPFSSLLKSRDVEDPVNLYVHRPLAYAFVRVVYRTPITPNAVTLLAMLVGMLAGSLWFLGTPTTMLIGGVLVWSSAILDGADGILARAKGMTSQLGRALDGSADMVVAICTVIPGFTHLWFKEQNPVHLWLTVPAIVLTVPHLYLYDYYKESFLRMTRLDRGGEGDDVGEATKTLAALKSKPGGLATLFALIYEHIYLPYLRAQAKLVAATNPLAVREGKVLPRGEMSAALYREHNAGPMKLWMAVSLAPHSYLMAICGMFDRLDVYLWIRLVPMNVIFLAALLWQRHATRRTIEGLSALAPAR